MSKGGSKKGQRRGGRKKGTPNKATLANDGQTIIALARQHAPEAIATLIRLMKSDNDAVARAAADSLLDRSYGKPGQAVTVTGSDGGPVQHKMQVEFV